MVTISWVNKQLVFKVILLTILLHSKFVFSWNGLGHRIIAEIAYSQLTPDTKRKVSQYNRAVNRAYGRMKFVDSSIWLDQLRSQNNNQYNALHYINYGFSEDGTPIPAISKENAVTGLTRVLKTLQNKNATDFDKGVALRILVHVVGDIHQPLHATSRVSRRYPDGDKGGWYVPLSKNAVAKNLHAYWDNGGGYLKCTKKKRCKSLARKMAKELEREYPCNQLPLEIDFSGWARESHQLGRRAYSLLIFNSPNLYYQFVTIKTVKQRLAIAGCRLAEILNNVLSRPQSFPSVTTLKSAIKPDEKAMGT